MIRLVQLAFPVLLVAVLLTAIPVAAAGQKKKPEAHALLFGTTFTANGLSLPGIPVAVMRKGKKKPKWRVTSDARGEFAVRLPAGQAVYQISTESKEHENQAQEVEVRGEESVTVIFRLTRKGEGKKE